MNETNTPGGEVTKVPTKEEREIHYRYAKERPALPAAELVLKYIAALEHVEDERDAAIKFKTFVHAYLDQHCVPHGDPENQHQKEGCRIGARLDWLLLRFDVAKEQAIFRQKVIDETKAERDALREENARLKAGREQIIEIDEHGKVRGR